MKVHITGTIHDSEIDPNSEDGQFRLQYNHCHPPEKCGGYCKDLRSIAHLAQDDELSGSPWWTAIQALEDHWQPRFRLTSPLAQTPEEALANWQALTASLDGGTK